MALSPWITLRSSLASLRARLQISGAAVTANPVLDMLAHNWHLGLTSFGGPAVHFQIFHDRFVKRFAWLDTTTYAEMFALCQALCGPGSTKMLFGINTLRYGLGTGALAFFVWSLPMAIASFGLAAGVGRVGEALPGPVYALLSGLNAATVGIVALAAVQLGRKAVTDELTRVLVFLGACAGMLYNALWYFPVLMVGGGVATVVWDLKVLQKMWRRARMREERGDAPNEEGVELEDVGRDARRTGSKTHQRPPMQVSAAPSPGPETETPSNNPQESRTRLTASWKVGALIIAAFLASFIALMVCRALYPTAAQPFPLFANLYLAGTIIFGGGPVVIPLLREYVVAPGWVSPRDFLLGLAITQAFPGPNFNFAVYLGALAVRPAGLPAIVGAVIGFVAIFTPGMWLFAGSMGVWAKVRQVRAVRACLRGVHATAVGLVFTAVYRLFEIGYLDEEVQSGGSLSRDPWWVVVVATSFVGGMNFKVSPPVAIVLGAVMGLVWYAVVNA